MRAVSGFMISLTVMLSFPACPLHVCSEYLHGPFFFPRLLSCPSFSSPLDVFLHSRERQQKEEKGPGRRAHLSEPPPPTALHCGDLPRTFVRTQSLKMCQIEMENGVRKQEQMFSFRTGKTKEMISLRLHLLPPLWF